MWNLGINLSHNASLCLMHCEKVIFYLEEERISRKKYDCELIQSLRKLFHSYPDINIEHIGISALRSDKRIERYKKEIQKYSKAVIHDFVSEHHKCHAFTAFYNSGMKEALCFSFDGSGSRDSEKKEIESVYKASYVDGFEELYKRYYYFQKESDKNQTSVGELFSILCSILGYDHLDAGKIMGLSAYGKLDPNIPKVYDFYNSNASFVNDFLLQEDKIDQHRIQDICFSVQTETQEYVRKIIYEYSEKYSIKNIVLSGGYFLNCVANTSYLRDDLNIYIEPISHDGGTSIGVAKHLWNTYGNASVADSQKSIYYGFEYKIEDEENVSYNEIAKLLIEENPVCIFQGKSEGGPRALGNRSILMDPRIKNGKDKLNQIKRRESYRPFAAVILEEYAKEWFDMKNLKSSPYMLYSLNCFPDKTDLIPAVLHVDRTSRIQTVNENQNSNLYRLIKVFYNMTGIPLLLNTSFNLAGHPLVESVEDAYYCMKNSKFEYLFFPESMTLKVFKNNV